MYGNVTTGAESDIAQLTDWPGDGRPLGHERRDRPGRCPPDRSHASPSRRADGPSEETRRIVDAEARRLVEQSLDEVHALLARTDLSSTRLRPP